MATPSVRAMASTITPIMSVRGSVQAFRAWLGGASSACGSTAQEAAHGGATEQRHEHADDTDVPADADPERTSRSAPIGRAGHRAQAERGVEARHDRAVQEALDLGALDVHRDVPGAGAETDQEQARRR